MRLFLLSFLPDFVKPSIFCKDFVVTGVESALPSFKVVATGQFRVLSLHSCLIALAKSFLWARVTSKFATRDSVYDQDYERINVHCLFLLTLLVSRQVLKPNIVIIKITTKKYRVDALILTAHYFCCSPRLTQIILVYPAISHSFLAFPSVTSWIWML